MRRLHQPEQPWELQRVLGIWRWKRSCWCWFESFTLLLSLCTTTRVYATKNIPRALQFWYQKWEIYSWDGVVATYVYNSFCSTRELHTPKIWRMGSEIFMLQVFWLARSFRRATSSTTPDAKWKQWGTTKLFALILNQLHQLNDPRDCWEGDQQHTISHDK